VPPSLELPKPVADLKAVRKGDKVYLGWSVPARTTDGETVRNLGPTRVCRSLDASAKDCAQVVGEVKPAPHGSTAHAPDGAYVDKLSAEDLRDASRVFSYTVSVLNDDGRSAGLSNRIAVSAAPTLPAPGDFKVQVMAEGVGLSWSAVAPVPGLHNFYRIYRRQEGGSDIVAGEVPLDPPAIQFADRGFEWEKTYSYHVAVVTEVSGGMQPCGGTNAAPVDCATVYQVEGDDTPVLKVFADDTFPPAMPEALQAVFSGAGQKSFVDLVWAPNSESDLAGYNVYRHEAEGKETKLNSDPIKVPAFRDAEVQSGKKYVYSVTAVDARGNESGRSEPAEEQVP
jgi:hypothetical protein